MELAEGKQKFIEAWGKLGSEWGINRTMAQVHALLLVTPDALTTEEIMEQLSISRGNANMTLRDLMGWGLVEKQLKAGERKEYFFADKNTWNIAPPGSKRAAQTRAGPGAENIRRAIKNTGGHQRPRLQNLQQIGNRH